MLKPDTSTESWNSIADDWVRHADTNDYRIHFLMPRALALLGDVRNRRLLDLGCGEGGYARELARRGAIVTAIDGSERLIEIARQRTRDESVEYACANASSLTNVASETFDIVLAAMTLMDVEDYDSAIRECHRVLRSGGELLMSILHPCFTNQTAHWMRNEQREPTIFALDHYLDRNTWEERITDRFSTNVIRRHRPLEDYMNGAVSAGFLLRDFREPAPNADEMRLSRRFAKIARIPYFLFMKWVKP